MALPGNVDQEYHINTNGSGGGRIILIHAEKTKGRQVINDTVYCAFHNSLHRLLRY